MRTRFVVALALVAALVAGHGAFAFQEQRASTPQQADAPAAPPVEAGGDKATLNSESVSKPETGTEIRIPGLGKLGVLPKMDFGLELLYGAAETSANNNVGPVPNPEDDLTVRGSVKHRF
jgi:hypothetical protein